MGVDEEPGGARAPREAVASHLADEGWEVAAADVAAAEAE